MLRERLTRLFGDETTQVERTVIRNVVAVYDIAADDDRAVPASKNIDILPLALRPKASDMTDMDAVVVNYEPDSDEFKRIAVQLLGQKSHCMYGPSFLVF